METVAGLQPGEEMRLHVITRCHDGRIKDQVVVLPFNGDTAEDRLDSAGAWLDWDDEGRLMIDDVGINSRLEKLGVNMDDPTEVLGIEISNPRPAKWMFSSPGLLIMALVVFSQVRRKRRENAALKPGGRQVAAGALA